VYIYTRTALIYIYLTDTRRYMRAYKENTGIV
jgi:hypothetical protein